MAEAPAGQADLCFGSRCVIHQQRVLEAVRTPGNCPKKGLVGTVVTAASQKQQKVQQRSVAISATAARKTQQKVRE